MVIRLKKFHARQRQQQNHLRKKLQQQKRLSLLRRKQLLKKYWVALARRIKRWLYLNTLLNEQRDRDAQLAEDIESKLSKSEKVSGKESQRKMKISGR